MTTPTFYDGGRPCALTPSQIRDNAWDCLAGATIAAASWVWDHSPPDTVCEGWARFVRAIRRQNPTLPPAALDWPEVWGTFVDEVLAHREDWKAAIGLALDEPHIG